MKKMLLLLVAAVVLVAVGTAAAAKQAKAPGQVTIALSQPVVTFGGSVTVSGMIGSHQAGQKVDVLAKDSGQTSLVALASVDTTTGGAWTYTAKPTIQTAYEATWLTATSQVVVVKVRPQLTLTKVSLSGTKGTFSVKATANRSFAGKHVLVQRLAAAGVTQLKKVVLGNDSSATFTIRVQSGKSRLRAMMPTSQTQPGYVAGQSAVLAIH